MDKYIWLLSFLYTLKSRLKLIFNTYRIQIIIATTLFVLATPIAVYAFDPNAGAQNVLSFIKFIIIILVAVAAGKLLLSSQVVQAVIIVAVSGIIYVMLDENMMKILGQGLANLMGMNGNG